ncbi:MAG TPA: phosphatase PAP2 family protein [Gemmatimonadales bacterium]
MQRLLTPLILLAAPTMTASAQGQTPTTVYGASWADIAAVSAAGATALLPVLLKLPSGAPSCAPCDPAGLPGIDRWVVGQHSSLAQTGSNALLLGVGGMSAVLTLHDLNAAQERGNLAVLANSVTWTAASTQWIKVLVRRKRPVLYTSGATAAAPSPDSQRSFPSSHTSLAFSVATSYLVMARREHLPHRARNALLLYAGAAGVGALRVAGGDHFPTDVIGGAALGTAVGWLVATLHPHTP